MEFMVLCMAMPHPKHVPLIRLQAGKGHGLEVIHDAGFLLGRHSVFRMPGKDPGRELPFGVQGVDQLSRQLQIATQHFGRMFVPVGVIQTHEIVRRPIPGPLAVREDLHVHGVSTEGFDSRGRGESCWSLSAGAASRLSALSKLKRAANTRMASARLLYVLAHRAS